MPRVVHRVLLLLATFAAVTSPVDAVATRGTAQQSAKRSDEDVRKQIQERLASEPQLKGLSITVRVDADRVVLGGRIRSIAERNLALQIASAYSEGRQVVDDFQIIPG